MKGIVKSIMQFGVIWLICFGLLSLQPVWAATNISSTYKYAWSENAGWQNWRSTNAQATVGVTYLVGYVWAENIGWIKLGDGTGPYANNATDNWGVNRDGSGNLSGYAWSENVGWINFHPTDSQVIIAPTDGKFSGYAWGENVGWIHFQNAPPEYYVQQVGPLVVDLVSFTAEALEDRVFLEWETACEIDNTGFHIWRTDTEDAEYVRITDYLIPAEGGATWGATYSYEDFDVEPGRTYYYKLEDIDYAGVSTFHGPVSAWVGVVDIKANGSDSLVVVSPDTSVSVSVDLNPGEYEGQTSELWIAANTPFAPPFDWYTYVYPTGWQPGIHPCAQTPLFDLSSPLEVLNMPLQLGYYIFYFAVDDLDGMASGPWLGLDSVEVEVR